MDAKGQRNGQPAEVHARCEHEDGYELTAIPIVANLMQYEGIRGPGIHMMGQLVEPDQLLKDMERIGVRFNRN